MKYYSEETVKTMFGDSLKLDDYPSIDIEPTSCAPAGMAQAEKTQVHQLLPQMEKAQIHKRLPQEKQ